tara:strand:+ start:3110 stop:3958 length:849 start_codon:yes stop_codon:yes gene_type:complete
MPTTKKNIYEKVAEVVALVEPFAKEGQNAAQGFAFVKIEQIINFARPLLSSRGILVIPSGIRDLRIEHYETKNGGTGTSVYALFDWTWTDGEGEFTSVSIGEANDTGDKAANKAQTAAWKQTMTKVLEIVADDDNDAQHVERGNSGDKYAPAPQNNGPPSDEGHGVCTIHNVALRQSAKQKEFNYPASHKDGAGFCTGGDAVAMSAPPSDAERAARAALTAITPEAIKWPALIADWFPELANKASAQLSKTDWKGIEIAAQSAAIASTGATGEGEEIEEVPW